MEKDKQNQKLRRELGPCSPGEWLDAIRRLKEADREVAEIWGRADRCPWPENVRPATPEDIVPGRVIWSKRGGKNLGWRIVRESWGESEYGFSYEDEDGSSYYLSEGDFVEVVDEWNGERYKQLRTELGLDQSALAELLNTSRETISRRERDRLAITIEAGLAIEALVIKKRAAAAARRALEIPED